MGYWDAGGVVLAVVYSVPGGALAAVASSRLAGIRVAVPWGVIGCVAVALSASFVVTDDRLLLIALVLGWVLLVLALVDALVFRLPDALVAPLAALGLLLSFERPLSDLEFGPISHVAAAVLAYAALRAVAAGFRQLRGYEGLGAGDAKLFGAAGAWLGWQPLPALLLIASLVGLLWVGVRYVFLGRQTLREKLPFGAPLCLAFWLVWLGRSCL